MHNRLILLYYNILYGLVMYILLPVSAISYIIDKPTLILNTDRVL
jgi:hypothetical protein